MLRIRLNRHFIYLKYNQEISYLEIEIEIMIRHLPNNHIKQIIPNFQEIQIDQKDSLL